MIGVTLISVALLAAAVVRFDDRVTGRIPTIGLLVFGIGALAVAARYSDQVQWTHSSAWAYLAVTLALAVVALTMLPRSGEEVRGPHQIAHPLDPDRLPAAVRRVLRTTSPVAECCTHLPSSAYQRGV
jgi:Ca2+/H+ antiporter